MCLTITRTAHALYDVYHQAIGTRKIGTFQSPFTPQETHQSRIKTYVGNKIIPQDFFSSVYVVVLVILATASSV